MRQAIAEAEVGDDVLDGDPTTRRLEERIAELTGMEAALLRKGGPSSAGRRTDPPRQSP
jgi:threonine aldolase